MESSQLSNKETSRCHETIYKNFKALTQSMGSSYEPVHGKALTKALKRCESEYSKTQNSKRACLQGAREVALKAKGINCADSSDVTTANILGEEIKQIDRRNRASEDFRNDLKNAATEAVTLSVALTLSCGAGGAILESLLNVVVGPVFFNCVSPDLNDVKNIACRAAQEGAISGAKCGSVGGFLLGSGYLAAQTHGNPTTKDSIYWKYLKA